MAEKSHFRKVREFIIPSHGRAYTFSIVRPAESTGAKLWPFAPRRRSPRNHLKIVLKCLNNQILGGRRV